MHMLRWSAIELRGDEIAEVAGEELLRTSNLSYPSAESTPALGDVTSKNQSRSSAYSTTEMTTRPTGVAIRIIRPAVSSRFDAALDAPMSDSASPSARHTELVVTPVRNTRPIASSIRVSPEARVDI